jgi:hypothetical protein
MTMAGLAVAAVDLALAVLILEAVVLVALRGLRGRGLPVSTTVLIAAAGLGLLAALRAALAGGPAFIILLGLTIGGVAHAIDLVRRLRAGSPS